MEAEERYRSIDFIPENYQALTVIIISIFNFEFSSYL